MKTLSIPRCAAAAALSAMAGCASQDPASSRAWRIEPVMQIRHSVQDSEAHYRTGRYFDGMESWDRAIEAYRKSVGADPQNIEARNALGVALARRGYYQPAEDTLRTALALDPTRAHVRSNLGYVLLLAGKDRDALPELQAAVAGDEDNEMARANLALALSRSGTAVTATDVAASSGEQKPIAPIADTASIAGPFPPAIQVIDRPTVDAWAISAPLVQKRAAVRSARYGHLALAPDDADAFNNLGHALVLTGQLESAREALLQALKLEPDHVRAQANLAWAGELQTRSAPPAAPALQPQAQNATEFGTRRPAEATTPIAADRAAAAALTALPSYRIEVVNGNGIAGIAARMRGWLVERGVMGARLSNLLPFRVAATRVEYQPGYAEQAREVSRRMPTPSELVSVPASRAVADVRVVIGHDVKWATACAALKACKAEPAVMVAGPVLQSGAGR